MNTGKTITDEELNVLNKHVETVNKHWNEYQNVLTRKITYEEKLFQKYGCDTRHYPHHIDIRGAIHEEEL